MQVAEFMTRDVITVHPDDRIAHAARLMLDHHLSGLPVLADDGALVGILTEGDLLRRIETGTERHRSRLGMFFASPDRLAGEYVQSHGRKVSGRKRLGREVGCG